jgi:hypothetical protein
MATKTITRPQFEALRLAAPFDDDLLTPSDALRGRKIVDARPNTCAVLVRLNLAEEVNGQTVLTWAGELIAVPLQYGGRLVSLEYIAGTVQYAKDNPRPVVSVVIAEHHNDSSSWVDAPTGARVSFLTGSSKTHTLARRTGVVQGREEDTHGQLVFRAYVITEDVTGETHKVNSGRVRVLNGQTAPDAVDHKRCEHRKSVAVDHATDCPVYADGALNSACVCHYSDARCEAAQEGREAATDGLTDWERDTLANAHHAPTTPRYTTADENAAQEGPQEAAHAPASVWVTTGAGVRIEYAHVPNGDPARVAHFLADARAVPTYRDVSTAR